MKCWKRQRRTASRPTEKGDVSFEILGGLDPARVEAACPHAQALLERLRNL